MNPAIVFAYFAIATSVIVAVAGLLNRNCRSDPGCLIFRNYFVVAAIADLLLLIVQFFVHNNMMIFNAYCLVQFIFLTLALSAWIENTAWRERIRQTGYLLAIGFAIHAVSIQPFENFDSSGSALQNVLIALLSGYLLVSLTNDRSQMLFKNFRFWFIVAVFIYFSVNAIVFATANLYLGDGIYLRKYTWNINTVLTILSNILYLKGLRCLSMKKI